MPYITEGQRQALATGSAPQTPGELNYVITQAICGYLLRVGKGYGTINEVVGVLECAKLELYRRIAAPYEDVKQQLNGDVYPYGVKQL